MIGNILVLLSMLGIIWFINVTGLGSFTSLGEHAALAFGFILMASYVVGRISRRFKLPMITGYLLAGFFFGPHVLGKISPSLRVLTPTVLDELSFFNTIALGLIAFSAGGEMQLDAIKKAAKSISFVAIGQSFLPFALIMLFLIVFGRQFEVFASVPFASIIGVGLILGVIAMANSPSSTLALIVEYKAKGPLTTISLGVTILKDVVVIVMFSIAMILAKILLLGKEDGIDLTLFGLLLWEVVGSIGIGMGLGYLMGKYLKYVGREMPLILLALSFVGIEISRELHLSGLLLCMSAGFYVENFTNKGKMLLEAIEHYSLPIFVLFFTITGAKLELHMLVQVWPLVVTLVALRAFAIWAGTTGGSALAGDEPVVRKYLWLGFLTQAGVSLGLATLIEKQLPTVGDEIKTVIVAAVALNQIIGPVTFRYGLLKSGEGKVD